MENVVLVIHVLSAIALVALVLIQKSEGGALSGLGGGGNPGGGLFSARATAHTLTRTTAIVAVVFMGTALLMVSFTNEKNSMQIFEQIQQQQQKQDQTSVPLGN